MLKELIISSRVKLVRNIKNKNFVDFMKDEDLKNNIKIIEDIVSSDLQEYNLSLIRVSEDNTLKDYLNKELITNKLISRKENGAFFVNDDLSISVNEDEHIGICAVSNSLKLKEEFDLVNRIDDIIENKIKYAFDEKYGYLTSSPKYTGTGLIANVKLCLPQLKKNNRIASISKDLLKYGMNIAEVKEKNCFIISNKITLGVKEDDVISNLENVIENITSEELRYREKLSCEGKEEMEDKVFRAEAILKSARMIKNNEVVELAGILSLGVDMSIIDIPREKIKQLFLLSADERFEDDELEIRTEREKDILRAQLVKEILG